MEGEGGQKEMLQQSDAHADTHAGGLGGRSLWHQELSAERQSLEGTASVGDAVNNLKSTHLSNHNSHLYPLLGCC